MDQEMRCKEHGPDHGLSRRAFLQRATAASAAMAMIGPGLLSRPSSAIAGTSAGSGAELKRLDPFQTIFDAMQRHPLVAVAELHFLQEWHDFITALLFHPHLPTPLTDIVVEFGNALYQPVADRFILDDKPVSRRELQQIWQYQGWDAPVYEQFFRTVRAVNWTRRPRQPIRVLLGAPPFDVPKVRSAADTAFRHWWVTPVDSYYATLVEREVIQKGRRALLVAGGGHLLRGLQRSDGPHHVNAATQLERRYPGHLYVVDTFALPPGRQKDAAGRRLQATLRGWSRPALATLAGTWLGATTRRLDGGWINSTADRAVSAAAGRYDAQADAVLYLGSGEVLTASQPDPAIFEWGPYHKNLERLNPIVSQIDHQQENLITESVKQAEAAPNWFAQFSS